MARIGVLVLLLLISMCAMSQDLQQYRWKNRIILLFADAPTNASLIAQEQILASDPAGIHDRDLLRFDLVTGTQTDLDHSQLTRQYNPDGHSFLFVLIGKDGTVKRSQESPVSLQVLFDQIDSMSMRQQEMRNRG